MRASLKKLKANISTLLVDASLSLVGRPGRTVGMMAGIMLGVASAVTAMMMADTQQAQIDKRFDLQRSNVVVIQAESPPLGGFATTAVDRIARLEPVSSVGELSIWSEAVPVAVNRYASRESSPLVVADLGGLGAAGAQVAGMHPTGLKLARPLVWLGSGLASRLGVTLNVPGTVDVGGRPYSVAGIIHSGGTFSYLDASVVMGRETATTTRQAPRNVRLVARVRPGSSAAVGAYAVAILDPLGQLSLVDTTPPDGQRLLGNVSSDLRLIGMALGVLIGATGMVAVGNIMSMVVFQRFRELGLRAALGWSPSKIYALILLESGLAGVMAAFVGCAIGIAISGAWALWQQWELVASWEFLLLAVGLGSAASIAGGMLPARRAAKSSPLSALQT